MTVIPQKLKGFKDYLPEEASLRRSIIQNFYKIAEARGFQGIDTPSLEYIDTLIDMTDGTDVGKELYRFKDHGDRDVAMRFDLTMPFSRFVAEHSHTLPMPFKRVQVGTVWRGEKPQKGRYREFMQADLDIIAATPSPLADLDLLGSFATILDGLVPTPAIIKVNSRSLLSTVMKSFAPNLTSSGESQALIALDKLDKIGLEKTEELLKLNAGLSDSAASDLLLFLKDLDGEKSNAEKASILKSRIDSESAEAVRDFFSTFDLLEKFHVSSKISFHLSPSLARGLAYYTGIVFETFLKGLPLSFGSIASGGRYDNLIGRFGKQDLCGVGGSLGVDRLLAALEELKIPSTEKAKTAVYLALADESARDFMYEISEKMRSKGIKCEFSYRSQKIANQIRQAERIQASQFIVIGSSEKDSRTISVKNLNQRTESGKMTVEELLNSY